MRVLYIKPRGICLGRSPADRLGHMQSDLGKLYDVREGEVVVGICRKVMDGPQWYDVDIFGCH